MKSRFGYRTQIPSSSSSKGQTKQISFKDAINTFKDNDDVKVSEVVAAVDVRFIRIGRYQTRRGADSYSIPVGEALNAQSISTAGAGTYTVDGTHAVAQPLTMTAAGRITRSDINIRSTDSSQGVLLVEFYADRSGVPGVLLCRSTLDPSSITSTFAYLPVHYIQAPAVANAQVVWVVVRGQSASVGQYEISTTTSSTTALTSATNGLAWSVSTMSANIKVFTSPSGGVKGVVRTYRSNGQKQTLLAYGSTIASVNDTTGATTVLKSDFNPAATHYRFKVVQDAMYCVNGLEKPWKYDFTTWEQLTAAPYIPSLIEEHKGLLFFNDVEDKTRIYYSNFADYGTFTSTDFIYVPAPKSYDALVAFAKLNGIFYLLANRNKFQLYGSDNDTFQLDEAASQRGTFSQESVVTDSNYIYHADDEGIWQFDGSSEKNLALPFLNDYMAVPNKENIRLDIYQNRLYCFYTPSGGADNTEAFVMNLQLGVYESLDTGCFVGRTFGRDAQEDIFIQASNRVAALYYGERSSNEHHNLGDQLQFTVKTSYSHFGQPGQDKRIPKWRPQFPSQTGDYAVQAGYDLDMANNPVTEDVSVRGTGPRYNTGVRYNTGAHYGGTHMIEPDGLFIPGPFKRVQRIYSHVAAREPVELDSEVLSIETQRLR